MTRWIRLGLLVVSILALACRPGAPFPESDLEPSSVDVELADLMFALQHHSAKLGYAIEGRNQPLASFYLHEIEEVLEDVGEVDEHEGMPIGSTSEVILRPLLVSFEERLEGDDWTRTWTAYEKLIDGCNRCHMATQHGFIQIVPAQGTPPFNQIFTAP